MARSHHRKKHKEHLRQFKHRGETVSSSAPKSKASGIFTVGGAIIGLAVSYFAQGSLLWIIIGVVVGGAAGYFIGRRVDADK